MKKLRSLLLIATILVLPFVSKGQFSREQAMDLVLNQILVSDTGHINLYTSYNTIPNTSNIILLNGQTISPPYFETDRPNAILLGMVLQIFNSVISKTEFVK